MKRSLIFILVCFCLDTSYGGVTWRGVEWEAPYIFPESSIQLNEFDELEVSPYPGDPWGAAHYSTSMEFRSAIEPFVEVSFEDVGLSSGPQIWIEDQTLGSLGGRGASTQFGAWTGKANYRIYWWDYDSGLSGFVDTGVARTVGNHTLRIKMLETGEVTYYLDGDLVHSTTTITPNFFGDVYLNANDDTATFTDYQAGDDYVAVPLPNALFICAFGTGLVTVLRRRRIFWS